MAFLTDGKKTADWRSPAEGERSPTGSVEDSQLPGWDSCRSLAHRVVDDLIDSLENLAKAPVWTPLNPGERESLRSNIPWTGVGFEQAYADFRELVLPFLVNNNHPRFFGWVLGSCEPVSVLGSLLGTALNTSVSFFDQSAAVVEQQVIRWLAEIMGMGGDCGGLFVSGCSIANFLGLACARESVVERACSRNEQGDLCFYLSEEAHGSLRKAARLLGLRREALREVPVDRFHRLNTEILRSLVRADRATGRTPFAVVGIAGGTRTGAIDDLEELAKVCHNEGLWLHVDGAFGALLKLSPRLRARVQGIERADSLAFDLHKWGLQPVGVGCFLTQRADIQRSLFEAPADYVERLVGSVSSGEIAFSDLGVELTRRFRALGVWLSWRAHGVAAVARTIEKSVALAQYLKGEIISNKKIEVVGPAELNIVNFRYRPSSLLERSVDALNRDILLRLQCSGRALCSSARVEGKFCLRAALVNYRTERIDVDSLVEEVASLGSELEGRSG